MYNDFKKRLIWAIAILVMGLIAIFVILLVTNNIHNKPTINSYPTGTTTVVSVSPSEFPDYDSLKDLISVTIVTEATSSEKSRPIKGISKHLEISGHFSRLYLYVEASVNKKPLTDWDSIYMDINSSKLFGFDGLGGHLFRPNSLATPKDDVATRLLFNTSAIPYINLPYSSNKTPMTVNWFDNVFNDPEYATSTPRDVRLDTFISTTQNGIIHLVAFYYSCASESPDCYIKIKD